MKRAALAIFLFSTLTVSAQTPMLFRHPTISKSQVVFTFAGDLWIAPRDGGDAKRLTAAPGIETDACFSPDGATIAFTGEYDGNVDVYTIPAAGGVTKRITYHPGVDNVVGWTPDGKSILFRSERDDPRQMPRLYTIPAGGEGLPQQLPLPSAYMGAYAPDAKRIAYVPFPPSFTSWKDYRGGRTTPIWIANLADSQIEKVPRDNSNDFQPMWMGGKLYFLSDRNGPMTLFSFDPSSKKITQVVEGLAFDIKSASAGPDAIVYEEFGALHLFDGKHSKPIPIHLAGDLPEVRAKFVNAAANIAGAALSPTGARAVFEARGQILTVPAEKGEVQNLTTSISAHQRYPTWSPDGKWIAYFSDESGEYRLYIRDASGKGDVHDAKKIDLGDPSFFYNPMWSPDSKKISYTDRRLNFWYVDAEQGKRVKIDTNHYGFAGVPRTPTWSPDSLWLAYPKVLKNHLHAICIYDTQNTRVHQVTDGMSDTNNPVWDKSGKYLFFTASTDVGPTLGADLSTFGRSATSSIYVAVLRKDLPSPLAPRSDDERVEPDASAKSADIVKIDFDDFESRIVAVPLPSREYSGLWVGKAGILFFREPAPAPEIVAPGAASLGSVILKYDLNTRLPDRVLDGVNEFSVSFDGEKMMWSQGVGPAQRFFVQSATAPVRPGEGALRTNPINVWVDPQAEWREMYHEAWRDQRDFFYDPHHHGLDIAAAEKRYQRFLEGIASRDDLNYLFTEMFGELRVSHLSARGPMVPEVKRVSGGLLGADYKIDNGRYRFQHVYSAESWNPDLHAPLKQPGVDVKDGDYLLAVNGRELRAPEDNVYRFFENTAGKPTLVKVGPNADGSGARELTVVPIGDEMQLRFRSWVDENRRKVEKMTGGKVAYVYLPDTQKGGYSFFNRYFFSQVDKQAVIVDERFNGGGYLADYVMDYLGRQLMNLTRMRDGADIRSPQMAIYGPKVMIINEMAGSGGDAMPFYFRKHKLGPLIGTRTWGGLVAGPALPSLLDGGSVFSPEGGIYTQDGKWLAENEGVAPDIVVEQDPALVRAGHDPQLEKAVEKILALMKKNPGPTIVPPRYKNLQDRKEGSK